MSIGHKYTPIRPLDKQKCPLDIQMSIRPVDERKCPSDIQMSIRPLDERTNEHCLMASALISYSHGVRLSQITSLQLAWHCKRYMSIGHKQISNGQTEMSIRPLDEQKCPLDIQMSIRPLDKQKCPLDINICPFVHSTN